MKNSFYSNYSLFGRLFRIKSLGFIIALGFILISFTLKSQNQTKEYYQTKLKSNTTVGYLSYLPPAYKNGGDFPLMIFLHGMGETGNNLDDLIYYGPPKLIHWGNWPADRPLVVISPQNPSAFGNSWTPALVDEVIDQVVAKYNIDESRIYITGTSMGGNGTWNYVSNYPERVAATVPICGWGTPSLACEMKNVPTWAFHNSGDPTVNVSGTTNMIDALEKCSPSPWPKETIYPKSGHDAWSMTYDLSAGHDIYSWMLSFSKKGSTPTNRTPVINAGSDKTLTLPTNSTSLTGSASDPDGSIASYVWSKVSGPSASMANTTSATLKLTNLVAGTYYFRLTAKDNKGASSYDDVKVTVNAAPVTPEPPAPPSNGNGLKYSYYEGNWTALPNFSLLKPKKTGVIANFSLSVKDNPDLYAFQFDGFIEITTAGNYTFFTSSDDGSKLYINEKELINNDGLHGKKEVSSSIYLSPGKHAIKVSYFEKYADDILDVLYSGPGVAKQIIPSSKLYTEGDGKPTPPPTSGQNGLNYSYYEGNWSALPNFSNLTAKKQGTVTNFSLSPKLVNDLYAFQFEGYIDISTTGDYTFYTSSDDGSKLYINNQEVVNNDNLHGAIERSGRITLTAGKHLIKVTYFEKWADDVLDVKYSGPGISKQAIPNSKLFLGDDGSTSKPPVSSPNQGLIYSYYEGGWINIPNFSYIKSIKTGTVANFDLSVRNRSDQYAFQFDGYIDIKTTGNYTFYTSSDDGSKLYIDSKTVVNNDGLHGSVEKSGTIYLTAGKHPIKVSYFEGWGDDVLNVKYSGPGISKTAIPNSVLSYDSNTSSALADSGTTGIAKTNLNNEEMNVSAEEKGLGQLNVYPNPFEEDLNITLGNTFEGTVHVSVMDLAGKVYYSDEINFDPYQSSININLNNVRMTKGIYLLQLQSLGKKEVVRIIKK